MGGFSWVHMGLLVGGIEFGLNFIWGFGFGFTYKRVMGYIKVLYGLTLGSIINPVPYITSYQHP